MINLITKEQINIINSLKLENFESVRSMEAFKYAAEKAFKLKNLMEKDTHVVLYTSDHYSEILKSEHIVVNVAGTARTDIGVMINCTCISGFEWSENKITGEYDLIYSTKKAINEYLKNIFIYPKKVITTAEKL